MIPGTSSVAGTVKSSFLSIGGQRMPSAGGIQNIDANDQIDALLSLAEVKSEQIEDILAKFSRASCRCAAVNRSIASACEAREPGLSF